MSTALERDLLRHGVQTVERPPPNPRLTTDETRFKEMLEQEIGYKNPHALTTDLDSLTAIHRIRNGRTAQSLASSVAVFVTRNYGLFRVSSKFFEQRRSGPTVPNCVLDAPFTTLVWLHQPLSAPDLPRERIIADAYAAMNPNDRLWTAYNDEIDTLREREKISEDDAHLLRLSEESKQALMDVTLGSEDAYTEGTALQVLERAREGVRADLEAKVSDEQAARKGAEQQLSRRDAAIAARAQRVGKLVSRAVFVGLIPLLAAGAVFGPLGPFADAWSPLPTVLQGTCVVALLGLSLWSVIDGITLRSVADRLARAVERQVGAILQRLVGG